MKLETLKAIVEARTGKQSIVLAVNLETQDEHLIDPTSDKSDSLTEAARRCAREDRSQEIHIAGQGRYFFNVFNAPLRLIIVGAAHIAQPLSRLAREIGYDVLIVDPREAFASEDRFPDDALSHDWPDAAIRNAGPDPRTAIVTLSHDPKIDDPALIEALNSNCFYIGALGSKKTHAARIERLTDAGFVPGQLARIRGPVGLSIGAKSPSEIAISILAQMTETLRLHPEQSAPHITAIVLAAGLSTRMGKTNKLLVDIGGKPMVRHVVDRIRESKVSEVLVVVGHEHEDVKAALDHTGIHFIENDDYQSGLSSTLKTGLRNIDPKSKGAVICLGDMPLVSARLIDTLIDEFQEHKAKAICVPVYDGNRGNPVLWPSSLFDEMLMIEGDVGAKGLIDHHSELVREVNQPDGALLFDVDTYEDLKKLES